MFGMPLHLLSREQALAHRRQPAAVNRRGVNRRAVSRHLLTAANPLPPALLAYVRAERLSNLELAEIGGGTRGDGGRYG